VDSSGVRQADPQPAGRAVTDRRPPAQDKQLNRASSPVQATRPDRAPQEPSGDATGPGPVSGPGPISEPFLATVREDVITALLGACLIGGILADGWAHVHLPDTLEGFFTPWHGLLYGGFVGTAAWTFWMAYQRRAHAPRWWRAGWPAGYRIGALGVLLFAAGGLGDLVWHEVIGVEVGLNAAFSPSHLLIVFGSVFMLTSPLRSWWNSGAGGLRAAAGVGSLALAVTATAPLLNHSLTLMTKGPTLAYHPGPERDVAHYQAVATVDGYLVTTLILTAPLLLVHRRRGTPGTVTALVGAVTLFVMVMFSFPQPQATAALTTMVAAVLADVCLARLDAVRGPDAALRLPIAGALVPAMLWTGHLIGLQLADGLRWPVEMWTGTVVLAMLVGLVLGTLAARPARRLP